MKDLMSIKRVEVKGKDGRIIPVARIRVIQANKYSPTYMGLLAKVGK